MTDEDIHSEREGVSDSESLMDNNEITSRSALLDKHADRERGIITATDREFLCQDQHGDEMNAQLQRDRRYRIRNRIKNAFMDFDILTPMLKSGDRSKVIHSLHNADRDFLKQAAVFLYLGYLDLGESKQEFLEEVIEEGERLRGNPTTSITVTRENQTLTIQYDLHTPESPQQTDAD